VPPSLVYKIINTAGAARDQSLQTTDYYRHKSITEIESKRNKFKFETNILYKKNISFKNKEGGYPITL
jgi:hypothetical protein